MEMERGKRGKGNRQVASGMNKIIKTRRVAVNGPKRIMTREVTNKEVGFGRKTKISPRNATVVKQN